MKVEKDILREIWKKESIWLNFTNDVGDDDAVNIMRKEEFLKAAKEIRTALIGEILSKAPKDDKTYSVYNALYDRFGLGFNNANKKWRKLLEESK